MAKHCPQCGKPLHRFSGVSEQIALETETVTVSDLAGWSCAACGEVVFDDDSASRYAAAGDALVLAARVRQQDEIRRIRKKLNLTQQEASRLVGVGKIAFSRYERGTTQAPAALVKLLHLIDRHPELLEELRAA